MPQSGRDTGQATPLYMAAVVGLLFFALVYLALGQADITRNGTQTAADAAALAAAQESRDQLNLADYLEDLGGLFGDEVIGGNGCAEAVNFAVKNGAAEEVGCDPLGDRWGFSVEVTSAEPMGESIIDGTEDDHARAEATAVVESRCDFEPEEPAEPAEPSEGEDDPDPGEEAPDPGEDEEQKPSPGKLLCDTQEWTIDPENLELLPDMAELFTVRLAED
ncbi:pilus assembly protein TadG-related protein [Streptomyces sp. NPDC051907]|uniref:pilus assembly protein TadG-related protein n=1 Tax=Streptomyces sp. NPDC051907 TaxID=3155284 RepID=UPI0034439A01